MHRLWILAAALGLLGLMPLAACTPTYPKCDKDTDCRSNEQNKDHSDYCVNAQCQQCRPGMDSDCGKGRSCKTGRCEFIPDYCENNGDCKTGVCLNNRCSACQSDNDCAGGRCSNGACQAETRTRCKSNDECKESEDCISGFCTPANRQSGGGSGDGGASCSLAKIYFDFNESVLSAEATGLIDQNAGCIKRTGRGATLIGRTDPRGTQEYNLSLSERRAQSVRDRLVRLGVTQPLSTVPKGKLDASGTDETGWARDRNVEFQWR